MSSGSNLPISGGLFALSFPDDTPGGLNNKYLQKEVKVRTAVLKIYNKRPENFETQREYYDYLEMVEDLIYNLVNNINVTETRQIIEQYEKENQTLITINQSKRAAEERHLQEENLKKQNIKILENPDADLSKTTGALKRASSLRRPQSEAEAAANGNLPPPGNPPFPGQPPSHAFAPSVSLVPPLGLGGPLPPTSSSMTAPTSSGALTQPKAPSAQTNRVTNLREAERGGGWNNAYVLNRALSETLSSL